MQGNTGKEMVNTKQGDDKANLRRFAQFIQQEPRSSSAVRSVTLFCKKCGCMKKHAYSRSQEAVVCDGCGHTRVIPK